MALKVGPGNAEILFSAPFCQHSPPTQHIISSDVKQLFYCSQILYKISLNLTKASILLLYLRAFTLRPFRIACWVLMAVVVAYGVAATVATILQCAPMVRAWDKSVPGTCFDIVAFWYANASYTIATDLILLVLPMRVIWGLQLRAMQKVAVLMAFAMGGLVTIFSIIRMTTLVASATSTDPTCKSCPI
jgi:hypothetical protein